MKAFKLSFLRRPVKILFNLCVDFLTLVAVFVAYLGAGLVVLAALMSGAYVLYTVYFFYGCFSFPNEKEIKQIAMHTYLDETPKYADPAHDISSIACGKPIPSATDIFGFKVDTGWNLYCAYIKGREILTSEGFELTSCGRDYRWHYVEEGFPLLATDEQLRLLEFGKAPDSPKH